MKIKKYYFPLLHNSRISIYPFIRIGGFGLGNMLFPFFRALVAAIKDGALLMYPHHFQIQPRNYLRNFSKDSLRNYSSDFNKLNWCTLSRRRSFSLFYTKKWYDESKIDKESYIYFQGLKNYFFDLASYQNQIQNFLYYSFLFKPKLIKNIVAFHLRLGDFVINNQSLDPSLIRKYFHFFIQKSLIIHLYSDSTLKEILMYLNLEELPNGILFIKPLSPLKDIIRISQYEYICGSPYSTFIEWARFIRPIQYPNNTFSMLDKSCSDEINITPLMWGNYFN